MKQKSEGKIETENFTHQKINPLKINSKQVSVKFQTISKNKF